MARNQNDWSTTMWLVAGAGMGLVAAFATRWYWGVGAFVLLALVTVAAHLMTGSSRRSVT